MADNSKRKNEVEEEFRELHIDESAIIRCYSKGPSGFTDEKETEED